MYRLRESRVKRKQPGKVKTWQSRRTHRMMLRCRSRNLPMKRRFSLKERSPRKYRWKIPVRNIIWPKRFRRKKIGACLSSYWRKRQIKSPIRKTGSGRMSFRRSILFVWRMILIGTLSREIIMPPVICWAFTGKKTVCFWNVWNLQTIGIPTISNREMSSL